MKKEPAAENSQGGRQWKLPDNIGGIFDGSRADACEFSKTCAETTLRAVAVMENGRVASGSGSVKASFETANPPERPVIPFQKCARALHDSCLLEKIGGESLAGRCSCLRQV